MNALEYARVAAIADTPFIRNDLLRRAIVNADGDRVTDLTACLNRILTKHSATGFESIAALEFLCSQIRAEIIMKSRN